MKRWLPGRVACLLGAALVLPSCLKSPNGGTPQVLAAPAGLTALPASDGLSILLIWTYGSQGQTGFRVDTAPVPINSDSDVTEYTTVPATASSYTFPTQPNQTWYFRVLAITTTLQSAPSNVVSATTPNVPLAPGRFDALVGPSGSPTVVTLLWDVSANETGYTIQRSANGGAWIALASPAQSATSYTDSTTAANGDYAYQIRANNANGSSGWSPVIHAQTLDTSWDLEASSGTGDISWFTSLAVGTSGTSYISSYDASTGSVTYSNAPLAFPLTSVDINPGFPATLGVTGTSIALDGDGHSTHIVANDTYTHVLRHLTNISGTWSTNAIDNPTANDSALIAMGPSNTPSVVYQHSSGSVTGLRYGTETAIGSWTTEWVTSTDSTDYYAMTIDPAGTVHVAYRRPNATGYELVYAQRAGGIWSFTVVPTDGSPEMCSIAATTSGAVYIAYNSFTSGAFDLVNNAGGTWVSETVHASPLARWGRYNSIALDPVTGEIHLSYQESLYTTLRYASRLPGGAWTHQLVDATGNVGGFSSIQTAVSGNVFIAYGDATNARVKLARTALRPPTSLVATPVSTSQINLAWTGLPNAKNYLVQRSLDGGTTWAVDTTLGPTASSFSDTGLTSSQIYTYRVVASNDFGQSSPSNLASSLPVYLAVVSFPSSKIYGQYNDLAVSGSTLYVVSLDQTNGHQILTTGPVGGPFTTVTSDSASPTGGTSNGIALSGGSLVAVDNYQTTTGGLRLTTIFGGTPTSSTLESSSASIIVGYYPKVRVAPNGTIHVLHMEEGSGGWYWRHAYHAGGTWTFEGTITPLEIVASQYTNNLAIDSNDNPVFAYLKEPTSGAPQEIVFGSKQSGAWNFSVLSGPANPFYLSLALDGSNNAYMAYIDNNNSLGFGTNATGSWTFQTLDPSVTVVPNANPAIAVDPASGRIHVVYSNAGLRYARKDPGGSWVTEMLDGFSGPVHVSLGLGTGGMIHVAYTDSNAKVLRILSAQP